MYPFEKNELEQSITLSIITAQLALLFALSCIGLASHFINKKLIQFLLAREVKNKINLTINTMINDFNTIKTKPEYNVKPDDEQKKLLEKLGESSNHVLFMGFPISGKTTTMISLANIAAQEGSSVYWVTSNILIQEIAPAHVNEIVNAVFQDAYEKSLKNNLPSYILIKNLDLSIFYKDDIFFEYFLNLVQNSDYRKNIRILATTSFPFIKPLIYSPDRLQLEIIQNSVDVSEGNLKTIEDDYSFKFAADKLLIMKKIQKKYPKKQEKTKQEEEDLV